MIAWISGTLKRVDGNHVIVETAGIGYDVLIPESLLFSLPSIGKPVEFYIHTHVREDTLALFGFSSFAERSFFETLTTVSGIGPKTAIGILSAIPMERLIDAIRSNKTAYIQSVPGIGKKTAERLVVELKDRLKTFVFTADGKSPTPSRHTGISDEVISALENLGYKTPAAESALSQVDLAAFTTFDKILKEALRFLAK